ncbi:Galectin [Operophtera brumata]|uniref:Galectin n=1 Tax=Operophtera brumata TaxID=104452 RepID=A0A0L7LG25_OPEBR|nr:Galectin [Operophtera brumata]
MSTNVTRPDNGTIGAELRKLKVKCLCSQRTYPARCKSEIELKLEGEEPKDVVLHFDVRFHRDNIISLSRKNGTWIGSGNYDTNYNMFVPGTIFRIIFEIKDMDVITIYCQGKFHSNFLPKIPLSMAKYIVAWADTSGDDVGAPGAFAPTSPRVAVLTADSKRCQRPHKKSPNCSPHRHSSNESSDEDKPRSKPVDRYFFETLMCSPENQFSPPATKRRDGSRSPLRNKINYKYPILRRMRATPKR